MHVPDLKSTLRLAALMLTATVGAGRTVPALDPNTSRA